MSRSQLAPLVWLPLALCVGACGSDNDGETTFGGDSGPQTTSPTSASETGPGEGGSEGESTGVGESTGQADDTGQDDTGADDGPKFDLPAGGTGGPDCECGNEEWSYIWIANRTQTEHTVAKINTRTMQEEGRYLTRPDKFGNPSRTSVSIDGQAVVVANRSTGVTKVWSRPEHCEDTNGMPGIQTSTGKNDVLPWGEDECIAWHTPFPDMSGQRPVQWTSGELNRDTCEYENQKVWTVTGKNGSQAGYCGGGGVWIHRLDGDTGMVEDTVHISHAEFPCSTHGPYGGAVDSGGNFWFHSHHDGKLVRVDFETLEYKLWSTPEVGYSITVDTAGRVWFSGFSAGRVRRFDPMSETWAQSQADALGWGGISVGPDGLIWVGRYTDGASIGALDPDTLMLVKDVPIPNTGNELKGVAVDIDGYVWGIRYADTFAYRVDPDTLETDSYDGLNAPYSYSDMTGGQINQVTCNPAG